MLLGYHSFSAELLVYHGIAFYASNCGINHAESNFLCGCQSISLLWT